MKSNTLQRALVARAAGLFFSVGAQAEAFRTYACPTGVRPQDVSQAAQIRKQIKEAR